MSKNLFIVESPNKCGKIRSFLGSDYNVMASVGHVRSIPKKGLNIDIKNNFTPNYEVSPDKKDVVKKIKEAAKSADKIYLASDPDREGAAIAWSIYELLDKNDQKKCLRISFDEITKNAVNKAINASSKIDQHMDLIDAQKARQVLDRLIGYKISPILWFKVGTGTSAGRVQSIALKFICSRDKEINAFKPQDYWYIEALLQCKNGPFSAKVITKDKDNRYLDEKVANEDVEKLKKASYSINSIEKTEKSVKPYPPFDTASIQTTCSSLFGWSVKKTATLAQSLYEDGKVTYIRTDSFSVSEEAMTEVRGHIKANDGDRYLPSSPQTYSKKSKSAAQEAHECIRPTHCEDTGGGLQDDEQKLYKLIRDRFIASQMSPMLIDSVVYTVKASSGHDLVARGQTIKFDGWTKQYKYSNTKEEILPVAKEKEILDLKELNKTKHTTQPPSRYNEGSLIKKMESEGVGRPSTYSAIMEALQKKGYAEKVKNSKGALTSTELGMKIFDYLEPRFSKDFFMDVKFTASLEDDLDEIASGNKTFLDVVQKIYDVMVGEIKKTEGEASTKAAPKSMDQPCPVCKNGTIVERAGKFGNFYACDKYPTCKSVFVLEDGKFKLKEKKSGNSEETGKKCLVCKNGNIVKKNGAYGEFYACDKYPRCKSIFVKNDDGGFSKKQYTPKNKKNDIADDIEE